MYNTYNNKVSVSLFMLFLVLFSLLLRVISLSWMDARKE